FGHFPMNGSQTEALLQQADHGFHGVARGCQEAGLATDEFHVTRLHTYFFPGFAHRSFHKAGVARFDAPTGKTDLPRVVVELGRTFGEQHMQFFCALQQRNADSRGNDVREGTGVEVKMVMKDRLDLPGKGGGKRLADEWQAERTCRKAGCGRYRYHRLCFWIEVACMARPG